MGEVGLHVKSKREIRQLRINKFISEWPESHNNGLQSQNNNEEESVRNITIFGFLWPNVFSLEKKLLWTVYHLQVWYLRHWPISKRVVH